MFDVDLKISLCTVYKSKASTPFQPPPTQKMKKKSLICIYTHIPILLVSGKISKLCGRKITVDIADAIFVGVIIGKEWQRAKFWQTKTNAAFDILSV